MPNKYGALIARAEAAERRCRVAVVRLTAEAAAAEKAQDRPLALRKTGEARDKLVEANRLRRQILNWLQEGKE